MTIKNRQIVVVDDDLEVHELITAFFKPRKFEVICFSEPQLAIEESKSSGLEWDVLLTDYHFLQFSNADFTKKIKESLPHLPIILITPLDKSEAAIEGIQSGAYDFITKPIHFSQLLVSVERALEFKNLKGNVSELEEIVKSVVINKKILTGKNPQYLAAIDLAQRVASSLANILISGESGTGKEVIADFIHFNSKRNKGPLIKINCSAIPDTLLESELFGHAKGSFTGAHDKRIGLFEAAEDGTIFLDEIGDLCLSLQAKLLRVLQEKKIRRVGENQIRPINCRIISATHKDLNIEVQEGRFREDLFFRLNVIPITIPPLRERKEDILPLAESFLKKFAIANDSKAKFFSKEALKFLYDNPWRGNIRELENGVERAVILSDGPEISIENFIPLSSTDLKSKFNDTFEKLNENTFSVHHLQVLPSLDEVIQKYINYAIKRNNGARDRTAKEIGIDRKTLYKRMGP